MSRRFKQSNVERKVNAYIIRIILSQFALCLVAALASGVWDSINFENHWYLGEEDYDSAMLGFLSYFTYFLLLNTMLPISLIISMEIIKLA